MRRTAMTKMYESDVTRMIRDLLADKPQIIEEQKKGRSMWWDKKPDPEGQRTLKESRVSQQAYVYQTKV